MNARITLRDVAAKMRLHISTVSRALRNDPMIASATRKQVRSEATKMGYRPDAMLSAFSSYRFSKGRRFGGVLGFLTTYPKESAHSYFRRLEASAKSHAKSLGFGFETVLVCSAELRPDRIARLLHARGIQGLLLAPVFETVVPFPDLDWRNFSVVAYNHSITSIAPHRACFNILSNTRRLLSELRALGYRRIGLAIHENQNERSLMGILGVVLAEQFPRPITEHIAPLCPKALTREVVLDWIHKQEPDCVIGVHGVILQWIQEGGYRIPNDVGFAMLEWDADMPEISGFNSRWEELGISGVELLVGFLKSNDRGIPTDPRYTMVDGQWVLGNTVRHMDGRRQNRKPVVVR